MNIWTVNDLATGWAGEVPSDFKRDFARFKCKNPRAEQFSIDGMGGIGARSLSKRWANRAINLPCIFSSRFVIVIL